MDTLDLHLKIYYDKPEAKIKYEITRDEIEIIKEETVDKIAPIQYITVHKIPWWMWVIVVLLGLVVLKFVFKR